MISTLEHDHIIGPLGSTFHRIKVPPAMRQAINWDFDWSKLGKRVMIDAREGIITWISPGTTHEGAADAADKIVLSCGIILNLPTVGRRGTRWEIPGGPGKIEVEADASYYIGQKADGFYTARKQGIKVAANYVARTPPDLMVEVEVTNFDASKPAKYRELGVNEMWQFTYDEKQDTYEAAILELQASGRPQEINHSLVLPSLGASRLPNIYTMAETSGLQNLNALLKKELVVPLPPKKDPAKA